MAMKLGLPVPERKEFFEQQKPHSESTFTVNFMGEIRHLPVIKVPIELPKYRLANGRTASMQQEYLASNPNLQSDFFTKDLESEEAQMVQHNLLKKLIKNKNLYEHFNNPRQKQEQPIILDENGFVINGNRRLCAWRVLFNDDSFAFEHFKYIDAAVLPPCCEKEIDDLEARLQVVPEIKDDYEWHSLATMIKNRITNYNTSLNDIADLYKMIPKDVQILLDALEYAGDYLKKHGKDQQWSQVSNQEHAFKRIVENRVNLDVGPRKLFEEISFALIANPEGGRVYEDIRLVKKHFEKLKTALLGVFDVKPVLIEKQELSLFGEFNKHTVDLPLAAEVEKKINQEKVRETVRDVIASSEQLEKDKSSANFLLKRLQKANSYTFDARNHGLKPESIRLGVKEQIEEIETNLQEIKRWLGGNV